VVIEPAEFIPPTVTQNQLKAPSLNMASRAVQMENFCARNTGG
jgi:hypothetical protein